MHILVVQPKAGPKYVAAEVGLGGEVGWKGLKCVCLCV